MKNKIFLVLAGLVVISGVATLQSMPVNATSCEGVDTVLIDCGDATEDGAGIMHVLNLVFTIVTMGVGALGILGVTIAGIMYMTARDSTQQTALAKKRMAEIALALIVFAGGSTLMTWIIPGGFQIGGEYSSSSSGGSESGSGGGGSGGSSTPQGTTVPGNREVGSESMDGATGTTGSGSEGWVDQQN